MLKKFHITKEWLEIEALDEFDKLMEGKLSVLGNDFIPLAMAKNEEERKNLQEHIDKFLE